MSISVALSNAMSGLNVVSRSAQMVSANIANALSDGYGRRDLLIGSTISGGARAMGVSRAVNPAVLSDRRLADAEVANGSAGAGFLARLAGLLGAPDSAGSLTGRLATFEGRLIEAASRPDSTTRLQSVAAGARDLATFLNRTGEAVQAERLTADRTIARDVELLNTTLGQIAGLNASISRLGLQSEDAATLIDQRQSLIDRVSEIVPVRQLSRDRGIVGLVTTGGQVLLDSRPAQISFTTANAVTPGMTLAGGQLAGLTIDGRVIAIGDGGGRMDGGRLAGSFAVRDTLGPEAQAQLDSIARDLIERFQDSSVDLTRAPGDPGLFTDAGAALAPGGAAGLAQRITLNALVDPVQGGEVWRLRDGLGATTPGSVGNASLLQTLADALSAPRVQPSGNNQSASDIAADLLARTGGALLRAEQNQIFATARADALREQELRGGVDTDQEMQKLLLIEQAYGANARVIQAIDEMMRRLLEI